MEGSNTTLRKERTMTGKSHKAIGTAAGFALMSYGIYKGVELAPLALVAAPFGSMLPDIDHDMTKMGRKRKKVTDTLKVVVPMGIAVVIALIMFEAWKSGDVMSAVIKVSLILGSILALGILSKVPAVNKQWKFATSHRGFMHTAIIPIVCAVVLFTGLENQMLYWILAGFTVGYSSHLFSDTLTTDGTPLLWPITRNSIRLLKIKTSTKAEYIAAILIVGGLVCLGIYLILLTVAK